LPTPGEHLFIRASYVVADGSGCRVHKKNPLVAGISKEELRDKLQVSAEIFSSTIDALVRENRLESCGKLVHLPDGASS